MWPIPQKGSPEKGKLVDAGSSRSSEVEEDAALRGRLCRGNFDDLQIERVFAGVISIVERGWEASAKERRGAF